MFAFRTLMSSDHSETSDIGEWRIELSKICVKRKNRCCDYRVMDVYIHFLSFTRQCKHYGENKNSGLLELKKIKDIFTVFTEF